MPRAKVEAKSINGESNAGVRPVVRSTRHNRTFEKALEKAYQPDLEIPPIEQEPAIVTRRLVIAAPDIRVIRLKIIGIAPLVQHAFSEKARKIMEERMAEGTKGKNTRRNKAARDFNQEFIEAQHVMQDGRLGIPAPGFRNAMITACSLVGFAMSRAKMSVFVLGDGIDRDSGMPLVLIEGPPPRIFEAPVRIGMTTSSVWRPMWEEWGATLNIEYDADQFGEEDVANLLARAGRQVGVGEGRPASRNSAGLGWGLWRLA